MLKAILTTLALLACCLASAEDVTPPTPASAALAAFMASQRPAQELLDDAKDALSNNTDLPKAIELLSLILLQPKGAQSEEALELLGVAYERSKDLEMAKKKYSQFITLYPESDSLQRVRQRLITLEITSPEVVQQRINPSQAGVGPSEITSASVSSYFFSSATGPKLGGWKPDQDAIITNFSGSELYKDGDFSERGVIKYSKLLNVGPTGQSREVISGLYYEQRDADYSFKLGRQTAGYGTLGRFDGAQLTYTLNPEIKLSALAGAPFTPGSETKHLFYGVGAEWNPNDDINEIFYLNYQTANGFPEREAIGTELHYRHGGLSGSVMAEYDLLYKSLNSVQVQLYEQVDGYSIFGILDHRTAPLPLADQALILGTATKLARPFNSVQELVNSTGLSSSQVYSFIAKSGAAINNEVIGVSKQLDKTWTVSGDVQLSNLAAAAAPTVTDISSVFTTQVVTQTAGFRSAGIDLQLRGDNLFTSTDTLAMIATFTNSGQSSTKAATVDLGSPWLGARIDLIGRLAVTTQPETTNLSLYGALRFNYRLTERVSIDTQGALTVDTTQDHLAGTSTKSYNKSFYFGLRVDF